MIAVQDSGARYIAVQDRDHGGYCYIICKKVTAAFRGDRNFGASASDSFSDWAASWKPTLAASLGAAELVAVKGVAVPWAAVWQAGAWFRKSSSGTVELVFQFSS